MSLYVFLCLCTYVFVCLCVSCMSLYVFVYLCMSLYVYVCLCISLYVFLCVQCAQCSFSLKIIYSPVPCVDLIKYFFKIKFGIFLWFLLKSCSPNFSIVSKLIARLTYDLINSLNFAKQTNFLLMLTHEMATSEKVNKPNFTRQK